MSSDTVIIQDKAGGRFFEIPASTVPKDQVAWKTVEKHHSTLALILYWFAFAVLATLNVIELFLQDSAKAALVQNFIVALCIYIIPFIFLHECGHVLALRKYNGKVGKIGFKLNYIFPSFYVRMNDTYMMDRVEKLYVHSAGLMISMTMNMFLAVAGIWLHYSVLLYLSQYMAFDILLNTIPMLNSDGYKILLALFSINEKKSITSSSPVVAVIKVFNIVIVVIYSIWFVRSLLPS